MKFETIYRLSVDVTLVLATLVLSIDISRDYPLARYYPLGVAVAACASYLLIDRREGAGIDRGWANALAFGASGLAILEWYLDHDALLVALGHWLVYLMVVKMFLPKTVEDDWFLLLLTLVQVLIGASLSQSDAVGVALLSWAVSALWVLGLFYLHREALRARGGRGRVPIPGGGGVEPYRGLIEVPYLLATVRAAAVTMALGGVIFLAMPRKAQSERPAQGSGGAPSHMTGFTDTVRLGQFGEILENDAIVMTVELLDEDMNPIEGPNEPLWRGISLVGYDRKSWQREVVDKGIRPDFGRPPEAQRLIYQRIKLEPNDSHVLFGMRPIIEASALRQSQLDFSRLDGSIFREELTPRPPSNIYERPYGSPRGAYDYLVLSDTSQGDIAIQPRERYPNEERLAALKQVPGGIVERLRAIAAPVVAGIPEDDIEARARALSRWLGESGEFHYTLSLDPYDRGIDPNIDFLINRKQGHCEYFASALTLLLRAEGIPARMISGFKGGDWSQLTRVTNVRQKHAHTWVEALLRKSKDWRPVWLTLDPTPSSERDASVARVGGFAGRFREITDSIRYVWVFYIVGFNSERQQRVLYAPLMNLAREAARGFRLMGTWIRDAVRWLLDFRGNVLLILLRGALLASAAGASIWLVYRIGRRTTRRLLARWVGPGKDSDGMAAGVAFYRRAARMLAEYGLERPPAETPREFAGRAAAFLAGRSGGAERFADVPAVVVEAFYLIRYGHHEPSPEDLKHLESRLDALEANLRGTPLPA